MKWTALGLVFCTLVCGIAEAETAHKVANKDTPWSCVLIRGRAIDYRGDGFFAIWHVGTHHIFFPADAKSADLICQYFDCESPDRQPALFADFTVCPTEPYQQGAAQPVIVKRVEHPVVFTDWPPPKSPREFVQGFYTWYAKRVSDDTSWMDMLTLAHWDLSAELTKLLEADAKAQSRCNELIGIDFDPFLLSQDPAKTYEVGAVKQKGDRYIARVYRVEGGVRSGAPDVIAEIARKNDGRWYFVNFYGPETKVNLLSILKSPRPKCTLPKHENNSGAKSKAGL